VATLQGIQTEAEEVWMLPETYKGCALPDFHGTMETSLTGRYIFTVSKEMKSKPPS
jgi:hypothetical protein